MNDDHRTVEVALENVDLPSPRSQSLDAIEAAVEYLRDHDGGTKAEITEALVPEENHPIGHNGVAAKAKGVVPGFRDWWWYEVIEPGLRDLSDVACSGENHRTWHLVDEG